MSSDTTTTEKKGGVARVLDVIERAGDKVPHPAIIFLAMCVLVIALSALLAAFNVQVTTEVATQPPIEVEVDYPGGTGNPSLEIPTDDEYDYDDIEITTETIKVESLLSPDGIRFLFTSAVNNFNGFGVVGVILVAMVGVGIAEQAGLIAALIRRLVAVAPAQTITFIIVLLGIISSVASDAGYLVLIPLGAAAFVSLGRHPLGGMAAAYAGVSAGFGVNLLITPFDGVLTEVTNEAARLVDPTFSMDITANLFFSMASTIFLAVVMTFVTTRMVLPRLGKFTGEIDGPFVFNDAAASEKKGLRYALWGFLACLVVLGVMTIPSWAVLRNPETGELIGDSPFMQSILFVIMLIFLVTGICYGKGARTLTTATEYIEAVTKTFAGLAGLIFLLLIISQFIAYFNYSNIATVTAVGLADWLESANVNPLLLLVGFIFVTFLLNIIIPGVLPKWAIFAPIFVPLFLRLNVEPQTVLAAYRIGDSPTNVITPLMVYLPFIVLIAQRYKKDAGVGTVVSLMLPYTVVVAISWTLFFVLWYLLGIPLGPGAPVTGG